MLQFVERFKINAKPGNFLQPLTYKFLMFHEKKYKGIFVMMFERKHITNSVGYQKPK